MAKGEKKAAAAGALGKGLDTLIGSEDATAHNEALPQTEQENAESSANYATETTGAKAADLGNSSSDSVEDAVKEAEYRTTVAVLTAANENERREDRAINIACRLIGLGAAGAIAVAACTIAGTKAIFSMKR